MARMWIYGPCGVGKTATGLALYEEMAAEGRSVGFPDLDQLGVCLPLESEAVARVKVDLEAAFLGGRIVTCELSASRRHLRAASP